MSRLTTECRACGWTESAPVGLAGDAIETMNALWHIHDTERLNCSAITGSATLDTELGVTA